MFSPKANLLATTLLLLSSLLWLSPVHANDAAAHFATVNEQSTQTVNYDVLDAIYERISKHDGNRVDFFYEGLSQQGLSTLKNSIDSMASISPTTLSKDEQLTYWLNIRNFLVIYAIAERYPLRSLKKSRGTVSAPGNIWTQRIITVEGITLTLQDIETEIIAKNWNEPHILYGLYQGTKGGPAFSPAKAFNSTTIHEDLKSRGAAYINTRKTIRTRNGSMEVPVIFNWYRSTFFNDDDILIADHIKSLASDNLTNKISGIKNVTFKKMDYNLDSLVTKKERTYIPPQRSSGSGGYGS